MIRKLFMIGGILVLLTTTPLATVAAEIPNESPLFLREIKITGDEFVVLQATEDVDLGNYWLGYSSSDVTDVIVPTMHLPAQHLVTGQALLLTSDTSTTCDAVLVTKLPFSLSDTKGTLVLRQLQTSGVTSIFTTIGSVSWGKSTSKDTTSDPIDLHSEGDMIAPVWYNTPEINSWQAGDLVGCTLTLSNLRLGDELTSVSWPANNSEPPAVIESLSDDSIVTDGPFLPAMDVGLLPPQITELLPNPIGTGTDGTDEFIELYNPNGAIFDLSGFTLQSGMTTKHSYKIPIGTTLPPKSFVVFYSADTGLTLSNTSGQADLEDPFGTVIAQTDAYGSAKDGISWALAKGVWYWTSKPTPSANNVINQTVTSKSTIKTANTKKGASAVRGTSTTTAALQTSAKAISPDSANKPPIHPVVLALVVAAAVGYGIYEYRHDIANKFYKLRANRGNRK